jgi:protein-tyrosine phosphatase
MGNICRSPTAEVVMRAMLADAGLDDRVAVDSAGTGGWHAGDLADSRARRTLLSHGYDGAAHRARQFESEWLEERELVVAMDRENLAVLRRLASPETAPKLALLRSFDPAADPDDVDVPDPYYEGDDGFEHVLALVEAGCAGLLDHLRSGPLSADEA